MAVKKNAIYSKLDDMELVPKKEKKSLAIFKVGFIFFVYLIYLVLNVTAIVFLAIMQRDNEDFINPNFNSLKSWTSSHSKTWALIPAITLSLHLIFLISNWATQTDWADCTNRGELYPKEISDCHCCSCCSSCCDFWAHRHCCVKFYGFVDFFSLVWVIITLVCLRINDTEMLRIVGLITASVSVLSNIFCFIKTHFLFMHYDCYRALIRAE